MITLYIILGILGGAVVIGGSATGIVLYRRHLDRSAKKQETIVYEVAAQPEPANETTEEEPATQSVPLIESEPLTESEPLIERGSLIESEQTIADAETIEVNSGDEVTRYKPVLHNGETRYIVIKYSKSFTAKIIQSDEVTKNYYSEIKNELLSYKGVKSRISWKWETFRSGRKPLAKIRLRGKTLSITLALNAANYADSKYIVEDVSDVKSFVETPCLYRLKNDRRLKYSKDLIADVMRENGLEVNPEAERRDYTVDYPYDTTDSLIERKLIKELTDEEAQSGTQFKHRQSITVQEADDLMKDEVAVTYVKKAEKPAVAPKIKQSGKGSDKTKCGIVNIDTLSRYFESGETVTLEEMIKRIPEINKKTTYIKVLARGTLDKQLTVYADSYSLQAVKMIVLTGGTAIKN